MGIPIGHSPTASLDKKYLITGITDIDRFWKDVEPFISEPLAGNDGEFTAEDIYRSLLEKKMQLWVAYRDGIKAAMVTEVVNYPRKKVVRIVTLGGDDMAGWIDDGFPLIHRWAKEQGASGMEIMGRKGWIRVLDRFGYRHAHVILKKEI